MGNELDPGIHLPHSPWRSLNCASNIQQLTNVQGTNSVVFPTYFNPYSCAFSGNASMPFPGFQATTFLQKTSTSVPPLIPPHGPLEIAGSKKRFLVFDQSGDQTSLIFSSSGIHFLGGLNSVNPGLDLKDSNEANGSDQHGGEEMHEDTDEINALLYSDSDEDNYDEEASIGHSPVETVACSSSKVASSVVPAKRRRVDENELDTSLVDTASSAVLHPPEISTAYGSKNNDDDAVSSWVRGDCNPNASNKRLKRARIQETVSVLRRIIPDCKGKDAASILDEAIRYLMSLKLKAKSLAAVQL